MTNSINISLVAYHAVGDLSVIAVGCSQCGAVIGEPCRAYYGLRFWDKRYPDTKPSAHTVGIHIARKQAADEKYGRGWKRTVLAHYKLHLSIGDIEAAMTHLPDPVPEEVVPEIDFPVTRKPLP